jgi:hypothetical protein
MARQVIGRARGGGRGRGRGYKRAHVSIDDKPGLDVYNATGGLAVEEVGEGEEGCVCVCVCV